MRNIPLNLDETLDARGLARLLAPLLHKSEATILRDISRTPKLLPPSEECAGKKLWVVGKVVDWLPPGLGAALRRTIARENEFQQEKVQTANQPPPMKSIADELMAIATGGQA